MWATPGTLLAPNKQTLENQCKQPHLGCETKDPLAVGLQRQARVDFQPSTCVLTQLTRPAQNQLKEQSKK